MNPRWTLLMIVVTAGLTLGAGSCSRQSSTTTADSTRTVLPPPTSGPGGAGSAMTPDTGAGGASPAPVDTSSPVGGTLTDLRSQLAAESRRLGEAAGTGRFDEVSARALHTRDLVVALAGKTSDLPAARAGGIDSLVTLVTQSAEKLRTSATAKQADGVRAGTTELQGLIQRVLEFSRR